MVGGLVPRLLLKRFLQWHTSSWKSRDLLLVRSLGMADLFNRCDQHVPNFVWVLLRTDLASFRSCFLTDIQNKTKPIKAGVACGLHLCIQKRWHPDHIEVANNLDFLPTLITFSYRGSASQGVTVLYHLIIYSQAPILESISLDCIWEA